MVLLHIKYEFNVNLLQYLLSNSEGRSFPSYYMMKLFKLLFSTILVTVFVSCSAGPLKRIEKNPSKFLALEAKHQELVKKGKIDTGMPTDGVFLAMGEPDSVTEVSLNGTQQEEWNYYSLEPSVRNHFGGFWSLGGRYRSGWSIGPTIEYHPRLSAQIQIENGEVSGYRMRK